jgi:hypothetical protein
MTFLGIHPKEMQTLVCKNICTRMFTLFILINVPKGAPQEKSYICGSMSTQGDSYYSTVTSKQQGLKALSQAKQARNRAQAA